MGAADRSQQHGAASSLADATCPNAVTAVDSGAPFPAQDAFFETSPFGLLQLLRESDAAALLAVRPKTLRAWRVSGGARGPPFVKLSGGAVRYRLADLVAYIDAARKHSTSQD